MPSPATCLLARECSISAAAPAATRSGWPSTGMMSPWPTCHLLELGFLERILADGVFRNDVPGRFTEGYGVRPEEVEPFFTGFGFELLALLSTESLTVGLESELPTLLGDPTLARVVLKLAI